MNKNFFMAEPKLFLDNMNANPIRIKLYSFIKVISVIFITSAIGLELWHIYALLSNTTIPSILYPVFWIERFALGSHLIEGIIAAFYAPSRQKIPLKYGTYTFFVGTVGLLELFDQRKRVSSLPVQGESSKNFAECQAPSFEGIANPKSKIQNPKSIDK